MTKIVNLIIIVFSCNVIFAQAKIAEVKFNSPCFKNFSKTNRIIDGKLVGGYNCEFVFVPDVSQQGETKQIYYKDWWKFYISQNGGYIDLYPLDGNNSKAHIFINKLAGSNEILYTGKTVTFQRKNFEFKYNTDEWEIDTLFHQIKIIHNKTFRYKSELITVLDIEGWDLFIPKKCKTREGYSLVYSNKRGFVGSYVYFFPKENNQAKAESFSFIGDDKLKDFMKQKKLLNYFGGGIWLECDR